MRTQLARFIFVIVLSQSAVVNICIGQQDTTTQKPTKLVLVDESELTGTIVEQDSDVVVFRTNLNILMTIPWNQIKNIEPLSGQIAGGQYARPDANNTRLFLAPTARPLKSGQGYFSFYEIFFPTVAVGIAGVVNLNGGLSLIPGLSSQFVYFAPKIILLHTENLDLAGGLLYANSTAAGTNAVGCYYGVGTYGTNNAALTIGLGWGYYGSYFSNKPILLIGGEARASNGIKLITENWFLPNSDFNFFSFGIRFYGENLAADLALVYPSGSQISGFPFIPWLGFAYNFGTAH